MGRTACTEPLCLYKGELYLYLLCIEGKGKFRETNNAGVEVNEVLLFFVITVTKP
jgi:hypothetical protein